METKELCDMCSDLEDAASLSCDELGEWWAALSQLYPRVLDGGSKKFLQAYENQVKEEHNRFLSEFRIIERTETVTVTHKVRRLVHEDDEDFEEASITKQNGSID